MLQHPWLRKLEGKVVLNWKFSSDQQVSAVNSVNDVMYWACLLSLNAFLWQKLLFDISHFDGCWYFMQGHSFFPSYLNCIKWQFCASLFGYELWLRGWEGHLGITNMSGLHFSFDFSCFVDSCVKIIGVHDRVFDVNDKVDNSLEPRGLYGLDSPFVLTAGQFCLVSLLAHSCMFFFRIWPPSEIKHALKPQHVVSSMRCVLCTPVRSEFDLDYLEPMETINQGNNLFMQ